MKERHDMDFFSFLLSEFLIPYPVRAKQPQPLRE